MQDICNRALSVKLHLQSSRVRSARALSSFPDLCLHIHLKIVSLHDCTAANTSSEFHLRTFSIIVSGTPRTTESKMRRIGPPDSLWRRHFKSIGNYLMDVVWSDCLDFSSCYKAERLSTAPPRMN